MFFWERLLPNKNHSRTYACIMYTYWYKSDSPKCWLLRCASWFGCRSTSLVSEKKWMTQMNPEGDGWLGWFEATTDMLHYRKRVHITVQTSCMFFPRLSRCKYPSPSFSSSHPHSQWLKLPPCFMVSCTANLPLSQVAEWCWWYAALPDKCTSARSGARCVTELMGI